MTGRVVRPGRYFWGSVRSRQGTAPSPSPTSESIGYIASRRSLQAVHAQHPYGFLPHADLVDTLALRPWLCRVRIELPYAVTPSDHAFFRQIWECRVIVSDDQARVWEYAVDHATIVPGSGGRVVELNLGNREELHSEPNSDYRNLLTIIAYDDHDRMIKTNAFDFSM